MKPCYIYGITFYKSNKAREAVVYSEFITAKCLTTPPSCDKFTVNHGFLGLIALICYLFERKFSGTFGGIWLQLQVMWLKTGRVCNYVIALTASKYQDNKVNQSLSLHYILLRNDICWFANNILLPHCIGPVLSTPPQCIHEGILQHSFTSFVCYHCHS